MSKSTFICCIASLLWLWVSLPMKAQVRFEKISTSEGLSQSSINTIFQDKKGFLWFATYDGLNRYDGYGFTVFRHQENNPYSISNNEITAICEDQDNNLWVGTRTGGLNRMDKATGRFSCFKNLPNGFTINGINGLAAQGESVWVSSFQKGVFEINIHDFSVKQYSAETGHLPENTLHSIYRDKQGMLWLGTAKGRLIRVDPESKQFSSYQLSMPNVLDHNRIVMINEDRRGNLWVGTYGNGLHLFDRKTHRFETKLYDENVFEDTNIITAVCQDRKGDLWVCTDLGILVMKNGDFSRKTHYLPDPQAENSLNSHVAKAILEDRDGNIWIGYWEAGINVCYAQPSKFISYTHKPFVKNSPLANKVVSVTGDWQGNIWVGTAGQGLSRIDSNLNFTHYQSQPSNPNWIHGNDFNVSFTDKFGNTYFSVWNRGFDMYNPKTKRFEHFLQGPHDPKAVSLFAQERSGKVWVSTRTELLLFDPVTKQITQGLSEEFRKPLLNKNVTCIWDDADNQLWLGTFSDGIVKINRKTGAWKHFVHTDQPNSLSDNHLFRLYEDSQGYLWIGTNGGGLNRLNKKTGEFKVYSARHGLPNNTVKIIYEDHRHRLWLATNEGISCFDSRTETFKNYTEVHGLPSKEFLAKATYQSPRGEFFWGSMNGLVRFHPDSIQDNTNVPKVYITGLKLFNKAVLPSDATNILTKSIGETEEIVLKYNQSVLTFEFLALSYQKGHNSHYAYKLEGFPEDWNYVGTQRSATYTNLDPGVYEFKVKAANADGVWNEQPTTMRIVVLPPWYRTWWAYSGYMMAILALLWTLRRIIQMREGYKTEVRIREIETEKMRELDRLKTSFFTNVSHEFRTPVTLIISPLEKMIAEGSQWTQKQLNQLRLMHRNAQRVLRLINQLLDISKLESGSLQLAISKQDFVWQLERIVHSFDDLAEQYQINLQLHVNQASQLGYFDADAIEKIVYNLLSNAFKFTPERGSITVTCQLTPQQAILTVQDTGIGMSTEHLAHVFDRFYQVNSQKVRGISGTGIGLALTKELITLHRGTISVESCQYQGTTFRIQLPIAKEAFPKAWIQEKDVADSPLELITEFTPTQETPEAENPYDKKLPLILVVEDNDELRDYLCENLVANYQVRQASDGKQGLEKALEVIPDLIISDLSMPEMDGMSLCEAIKTNEKTSHIPFILLTAHHNQEARLAGLNVGADDYITKPFNINLLEARVKNLVLSRKKLRENFSRNVYLKPSDISLMPADEAFLAKVIGIIESRLADSQFDVEQLESALSMSKMQLYRKLKSLTDLSGNDFIRQIRLKRAAQLLSQSDLTVAEIAYQVGFNDPAYFTRSFKKLFGKSPTEYAGQTVV
ncbi:MAG: two-component regulator propeller domain-containing protein [Spirosomataceae bacterium]